MHTLKFDLAQNIPYKVHHHNTITNNTTTLDKENQQFESPQVVQYVHP